ncbi:hypothetical protein [Legionella sp. CNM-4043-24]|uniref:hypothetical protein n=1 Tax=Legionella sp. CNM-4043-24 TaxID=3421646 RepID=UPI00403AFD57
MIRMCLLFLILSGAAVAADWPQTLSVEVNTLGTPVSEERLPLPYDVLLTRPLMTQALEAYYQRKALIEVLYSRLNPADNTWSRVILMYMDRNKARNQPELARKKNEHMIVELAFIRIYFNELPQALINEVKNSNTPFGALLVKYHIDVMSQDRQYFFLPCSQELSERMPCAVSDKLFGRRNTLVKKDSRKTVANVLEILSAARPAN